MDLKEIHLGEAETRFAKIVWQNEPVTTSVLYRLSEEALGWTSSTTFTVLRRLSKKGLFQTEKGVVTSLISRKDFFAAQSEKFVSESFDGSFPSFFAAFTERQKLTPEEIEAVRSMIEAFEKGEES